MSIRQDYEELETVILSPYAALAKNTRGRAVSETECDIRTVYCRDRDRIIHCKAFRRLKQKTQVFLSPQGDHYRTRLTHTLEVSQIARTIARALRLNEDLTEAVALGHDLGHTPFGHAGEHALDALCPFGFHHYEQSARVAQHIEKNRAGLNLTWETLDGILNHTRGQWAATQEGCAVRHSDLVAYLNHDIEDAVTAGVLREEDLPREVTKALGASKSARITTLITAFVRHFDGQFRLPAEIQEPYDELRDFMYDRIYLNKDGAAKIEEAKVKDLISGLYGIYTSDPGRMPELYRAIAEEEGPERAAADYISGMSDDFAIRRFEEIFIPKSWGYRIGD